MYIKYKTDKDLCLTPCPHVIHGPKVASVGCGACEYHRHNDKIKQFILCNVYLDVNVYYIFPNERYNITNGLCPLCNKPVGIFKDKESLKQYINSGTCQNCIDLKYEYIIIKTAFLKSSRSKLLNKRKVYNDEIDTTLQVGDVLIDGNDKYHVIKIKYGVW